MDLPIENGDFPYPFSQGRLETRLTGIYGGYDGYDIPSGQRLQTTMENHHAMKMGKSTISTGPFSSSQTVNVYQRVASRNLDLEDPAFLVSPTPWTSIAMLC